MKIKYALILGFLLLSVLEISADDITIHAKSQPADVVFRQIVGQSGKNFVYASDLLRGITVSVNADNATLESVLAQMLGSTGIRYTIDGDNIILSRKPRKETVRVTMSGFVREQGSGEPIVGAIVSCAGAGENKTAVAATNTMGFYSLTVLLVQRF